jgi:TAG lipase/lysophosphatidylethanolamine acyltransferase
MRTIISRSVLTSPFSCVQRLYSWWTRKSTTDVLIENIDEARLFEEWEASAYQLDEVLGFDLWYLVRK